jgi:type IV pilus assembly protein PilA
MKTKGYTLMELMVVIAIIGILLSIAVPAYQNHVIRARVAEGINLAVGAKIAVAEAYVINNALPKRQEDAHYISPPATANVASVTVEPGGLVVVHYTPLAGSGTLIFRPIIDANGTINWDCKEGGTLESKYRPSMCK